jgi:CheY-like chemotaxis protein
VLLEDDQRDPRREPMCAVIGGKRRVAPRKVLVVEVDGGEVIGLEIAHARARFGADDLPRVEAGVTSGTAREAAAGTYRGSETILLVEDEEPLLTLGKMLLQQLGYTVLTARTPGEAINLAENSANDLHLLITDVVMPEMNGKELVERIRNIRPAIRYLYMSGYPADMISSDGKLDEGVHFIRKPFSVKEMSQTVRHILDME